MLRFAALMPKSCGEAPERLLPEDLHAFVIDRVYRAGETVRPLSGAVHSPIEEVAQECVPDFRFVRAGAYHGDRGRAEEIV